MALVAGMLGISYITFVSSGFAASVTDGITNSMKHIERQICDIDPSPKCKPVKKKTVTHKKPAAAKKETPKQPMKTKAVPTPKQPIKTKAGPLKPVAKVAPRDVPIPKPRPDGLGANVLAEKWVRPMQGQAIPKLVPKPSPPVVVAPTPPASAAPIEPPAKAIAPEPPPPAAPVQDSNCLSALAATGTSFAPVPQPGTSASCQIATPVRLFSVATKAGTVKLPDQPTVNCAFALTFSHFVDDKIQPLAQQSLGSAVIAVGTGPGYDCRGRNGDSSAKISEHAIGNAVDIEIIRLASKSQILVKDALNTQSPNFAFLRDLRAAACSAFTTVLGPGTNSAHAEHFHVDLEVRRGGFRLCE